MLNLKNNMIKKLYTHLWIFSISWKFVPLVCIFFTDPGLILLMRLHSTTPFLSWSSYDTLVGIVSPNTWPIHSNTSCSCSLFLACEHPNNQTRFLLIILNIIRISHECYACNIYLRCFGARPITIVDFQK